MSKKAQTANRQIVEMGAMEAYASANNGRGARVAAIVSELSGMLSDVNYQAFRSELNGLDLGQRLTVSKKWLSMTLVLKAAVWKNNARNTSPGGPASYRFFKAVEDARACGWTIQDARRGYGANVDFAYWGLADVDEGGQQFDNSYVPFGS